jgi:uncharacterized protein YbjT (DUF2867 family)
MAEALVTGGTGVLGQRVVAELERRGWGVRVLSRGPDEDAGSRPGTPSEGAPRVRGDLATGVGLDQAVAGVDAIVHCATGSGARTPRGLREVDVAGTRRLLLAARTARVSHFVYPSIVGIERVPFFYYRAKLAAEAVIERAGVPWTTARLTQFHTLVLGLVRFLDRGPIVALPKGLRFQPIDPGEAAERLAVLADGSPAGRAEDFGGPEALSIEDIAERYLAATGRRARPLPLPVPGRLARAVRAGGLLCQACPTGSITFEQFVRRGP